MRTVLLFLAMTTAPTLLCLGWLSLDSWLEDRAEARRREQQDRQADAAWFAEMAAMETTPVFDQLACEQIERAEGWS